MDIKRLHEAIKELRDELGRIDLAIQRIEVIAEEVVSKEQSDSDASEPASAFCEADGESD